MKNRGKLLNLLVILGTLLSITSLIAYGFVRSEKHQPVKQTSTQTNAPQNTISIYELFELTNQERAKAGIKPLVLNPALNNSAKDKCQDMVDRNYWAHKDPDGKDAWYLVDRYTRYLEAGENIAKGYFTANETTLNWMNSPPHKEALLNARYTDVGFAFCYTQEQNILTVQHFIAL
jgi:uncharacterized protein YkwD